MNSNSFHIISVPEIVTLIEDKPNLRGLIGEDIEAFFQFIRENMECDPIKLRLKYSLSAKPQGFSHSFAIDQIECRRKSRIKLPTFISSDYSLFPATISAEQATDEGVALFHSKLLQNDKKVADLTAGLGIDAMNIAKSVEVIKAVEIDQLRAQVLQYNAQLFTLENLSVINADSIEWIKGEGHYDTIFIDPARRGDNNTRKYKFKDCKPDITSSLKMLMDHCDRLLVKASPLLDLTAIREELPGVSRIWVVERKGECKELLVEIMKGGIFKDVTAAIVDSEGNSQNLTIEAQNLGPYGINYENNMPEKGMWLYEPSPAVMKTGAWGEICRCWPVRKFSADSHLFSSEYLISDFPGKRFKIISIPYKRLIKNLKGKKCNIITRNYPLSPIQMKKKIGTIDGGEDYLIGTRWGNENRPILILAQKDL